MKKYIVVMIVLAVSAVSTAAVTVDNSGFEDAGIAAGGYSYSYTPWESLNEGGGYTPWLSNGYYSPEMGTTIMYTTGDNVYQALTETFVEGTTYEFSMTVGLGHGGSSDNWTLYFYNGDAVISSVSDLTAATLASTGGVLPSSPDGSSGTAKTVSYTATAADAGKKIGIGFNGDYYTQFDNAIITDTPGVVTPKASVPNPAHSTTDISVNTITLSWQGPVEVTGPKFDVWFGTDQESLSQIADAQSQTSVSVTLDYGLQYFWRVDVIDNSTNPATVYPGTTWTFTVEQLQPASLEAGPYVHFCDAGEVTVYYKTSAPAPSSVQFGPAPALTETVTDAVAKTTHAVKITGITPETGYSYRIVINGTPAETHEFYSAFDAPPAPVAAGINPYPVDALTPLYEQAAEHIINTSGITHGICIDYGCGQGRLAYEIAKRSQLRIIGFESDSTKVQQARAVLDQAGVYGMQISIFEASMADLKCRDYTANLIVSDAMIANGTCPGTAEEMFRVLRPDGGVAVLGQPSDCPNPLSEATLDTWLGTYGDSVTNGGDVWSTITRAPLSGAGKWTHFYADTGNTTNSGDTRVDNSMKVLWYGNPGPRYVIDRHNRPMSSLYNKGIVVTPGVHRLMAYDAYNGTKYWDMAIPESAKTVAFRDTGWAALSDDSAFAVHKNDCAQMDLKTGELKASFQAPQLVAGQNRNWGYLAVDGNNIIGSAQKEGASYIGHNRDHSSLAYYSNRPASTSEYLFSIDTQTGTVNWTYKRSPGSAIINPCILVAGNYVYFVESRNSAAYNDADGRVQLSSLTSEYLVKLDKTTGVEVDSQSVNLPYTQVMYLSYVPSQDLILATGSYTSGSHIYDHYAYHASNLNLAWSGSYNSGTGADGHGEQDQHPVIVGDILYSKFYKLDLNNGSTSSLGLSTGGCGALSGCQTHLFARNGSPCMYALPSVGASKLTSETRIGCWVNMMAAGGLVIAPESGAGCSCDFQIQASMVFQP